MAKVVGWKVWMLSPDNASVEKHVGHTIEDWQALPDDGVLGVMLYYDAFSEDGKTRYRRVQQASWYAIAPGINDTMYLQAERVEDLDATRYPGFAMKRGKWTDDDTFQRVEQEYMNDYNVSELGIAPIPNTSDV